MFGVLKKSLRDSGTLGSYLTEVVPQPWSSERMKIKFGDCSVAPEGAIKEQLLTKK